MNPYIETLQACLSANTPDFGDADSLLGMLYLCYSERNSVDNQKIRGLFTALSTCFPQLTPQEFDAFFDLVCQLCLEHEKAAFLEGLRTGARLTLELAGA